MRIVVLIKEVPDTYGDRLIDLETGLADRAGSESIVEEVCERALEVALAHAESADDVEVAVLSMAPESATGSLRKTLAMGAQSATHISDEALAGADVGLTAQVLAAALRQIGFDLVITGNQSTDGSAGMLPSMLSELLEVPALVNLSEVSITSEAVQGLRASDEASLRVRAALPAVVSVNDALPDARMANFKGIMAAKKKPIAKLTLADLGVDAEDLSVSRSIVLSISERPARAAGTKVHDEGDGAQKLAAFLAEHQLLRG